MVGHPKICLKEISNLARDLAEYHIVQILEFFFLIMKVILVI